MRNIKKLIQRIKSKAGRSKGLITNPRRGSLIKRMYRFVDHNRLIQGLATVVRLDYDPNRNCKIALLVFTEGFLTYVLPAESNRIGSKIMNNSLKSNKPGDSLRISLITAGSLVYNLGVNPRAKGQYIRAAGSSSILVKTQGSLSLFKMKSGEYRYFFSSSIAVLGKVIGGEYFLRSWKTAGKSRRLGFRPRSRPLARNPVDHPMGGRTKGGTPKLTPKGKICLNTATKKDKGKWVVIKAREKKKI